MDHDDVPKVRRGDGASVASGPAALYRLNSNQSSSSVFEDVEMAHDEVPIFCSSRHPSQVWPN